MGVTLKDLFEHVRENKARLVVYRQITAYLSREFVSSDAVSAKNKLKLDEGGVISEEIIEEVIDAIYRDLIAPAEKRIVTLLDTELDERLEQIRAKEKEVKELEGDEKATPIKKKKQAAAK